MHDRGEGVSVSLRHTHQFQKGKKGAKRVSLFDLGKMKAHSRWENPPY